MSTIAEGGVALTGGTRWSQKGTSDPVSDVRTGIDFIMPESEIRRIIEDAGFEPHRRYQNYSLATEGEACSCCGWREGVAAAV